MNDPSSPCPCCTARVIPWLVANYEAWHGPRAKWGKRIKARFHEDESMLHQFATDFRIGEGVIERTTP